MALAGGRFEGVRAVRAIAQQSPRYRCRAGCLDLQGGADGEGDVAEVFGWYAASGEDEVAGPDLIGGDREPVGDLGERVGGDRDADRAVGVRDQAAQSNVSGPWVPNT